MSDATEITPATRVGELLDRWPWLEEVLVEMAPAFAKLRNPVLRRTVARVATLEMAASIGGVSVRELVRALRRAAGQTVPGDGEGEAPDGSEPAEDSPPPPWVAEAASTEALDADAILAEGRSPLGPLMARAQELREGEVLRIATSFRPAPLMDALRKRGFRVHCRSGEAGGFETFVGR